MANRSSTVFECTTADAGDDRRARDDGPSSDRAIFHNEASFEAVLVELAAGAQAATVSLPRPGEIIAGKYRVEEQLGQGGSAVVYRATHLISGKQIALKWMLSAWSDTRARTRFVREARAAARVDHRNVVDIYDIGQDGDRGLYMVMQLLRGESLAKRLSRGRLAIEEAVHLLLPAMRGVAAVHAAGVIHRDLKPDNIFLCTGPAGLPDDAKVLDFGISAVSAQEDADLPLTRDGAMVGTLAYMSPEQIQDSRAVDARADVYAFGVILYEALTGHKPFRAETRNALVLAIIAGNPPSPRELRADLPENLAQVVLRALAQDRANRFPDIRTMIDALCAPDLYDRSGRDSSLVRGRAFAPVAGALFGALILTLTGSWWFESRVASVELVAVNEAPHVDQVARPRVPLGGRSTDSPQTSEPPAPSPLAVSTEPTPRKLASDVSNQSVQAATLAPPASRSKARSGPRRTKSAARPVVLGTNATTHPSSADSTGVTARSGKIAFEEL